MKSKSNVDSAPMRRGRQTSEHARVEDRFVDYRGERFCMIENVDKIDPFLITLVSESDHWFFVASNGGLSIGRVSPEEALFPYVPEDKIIDGAHHTGPRTVFRIAERASDRHIWEPFRPSLGEEPGARTRNLYKSVLGNKLIFEEINHQALLTYRYSWAMSARYGFVRRAELIDLSGKDREIEALDGFQNILPAGVGQLEQARFSNLVDAYKLSELDAESRLALYALYSGMTDKAEPLESLRANVVFALGLSGADLFLSADRAVELFPRRKKGEQERELRGRRGAYLARFRIELEPNGARGWTFVADLAKTQSEITALREELLSSESRMENALTHSVEAGSERLRRLIAAADGFQLAAQEKGSARHYASVLFNGARGGFFADQYWIESADFRKRASRLNRPVYERRRAFFDRLPDRIALPDLLEAARDSRDAELERMSYEYLPLTFARRHGDPSRPWNNFTIRLEDEAGARLLAYQGNWRDIFQNWEALLFSYPEFIESVIAKFLNASSIDGYNPYRISEEGIDWEVEDPSDPWSHIGYWGDHQIIYLLKLLELSRSFHPDRLAALLRRSIYSYANIPYRIKPFDSLLRDSKNTIEYARDQADLIAKRESLIGAAGRLLLDSKGEVYKVNLLEKLLVTLLAKLGSFAPDGGIWMNTQRPEWNDANNALVGQGLSMVTLRYARRYVSFLIEALDGESEDFDCSVDVGDWIASIGIALCAARGEFAAREALDSSSRFEIFARLGEATSRYRQRVYSRDFFEAKRREKVAPVRALLEDALFLIDKSIESNRRSDGLYHSYNLLRLGSNKLDVGRLYLMLEGQVAALSSGELGAGDAIDLLRALFESDLFRADQESFMLYPDRPTRAFLDKNRISPARLSSIALLDRMARDKNRSILVPDEAMGFYRFCSELVNRRALEERLDRIDSPDKEELARSRKAILELYEEVFRHDEFTGRSGGMFAFEGLGSIYWHMVAKLLLAIQEIFFRAKELAEDESICAELGRFYYRTRAGLGFNKRARDYGAFPSDPYSHTPKNSGARQPGMTGQVKEDILTRFGELGVRPSAGRARFQPWLLREREFIARGGAVFSHLDISGQWRAIELPARDSLAFTWAQTPIIYRLDDLDGLLARVDWLDGRVERFDEAILSERASRALFERSGRIRSVCVSLHRKFLADS